MPKTDNIICVSRVRLFLASILSFILYIIFILVSFYSLSGLWEIISGSPVEAPTLDFMSNYNEPAKNGYWFFVWLSILSILTFSVFSPLLIGSSIGQYVFNIKLINKKGKKISAKQCIARALLITLGYLLLSIPGPIIGFTYGNMADWASITCLSLAMLFLIYLMAKKDKTGRTFLYSSTHIYPVLRQKK